MEEALKAVAREGNIDELYKIIEMDPRILDIINNDRFVHTPLHEAALAGQTHFAVELMSLMPAFAEKLNPQGYSPLHLAVIADRNETARALSTLEPELICIKGRERMTPLHFAVKENNLHLLAHFLCLCPASIDGVTNKSQTAVHIAVLEEKLDAFELLLGWLGKWGREEVLDFLDEDGNTALHIAVETEQIVVVKKLLPKVNKNSFNANNLTALDIAVGKNNNQMRTILECKGCKSAKLLQNYKPLPDILRSRRNKSVLEILRSLENELSLDMRNVILVVAALIVTATYQGVLQPPGGYWQGNADANSSEITNNDVETQIQEQSQSSPFPGTVVMSKSDFDIFMLGNTAAFTLAVVVIFMVIPGKPYLIALYSSLVFLTLTYLSAIEIIAQTTTTNVNINLFFSWGFIILAFSVRALIVVPSKIPAFPAFSGSKPFRIYQFPIKRH